MCLGIPGKITIVSDDATGLRQGRLDFGGITKEACLAYVPEAKVGDYVIVHAGFAISVLDEQEALQTFKYIE